MQFVSQTTRVSALEPTRANDVLPDADVAVAAVLAAVVGETATITMRSFDQRSGEGSVDFAKSALSNDWAFIHHDLSSRNFLVPGTVMYFYQSSNTAINT